MNKHTPGPWSVRQVTNYHYPHWQVIGGGNAVCSCGDNEANARLIGAAPEFKAQLVETRAALGLLTLAFSEVARSADDKAAVEWARAVCARADDLFERTAKAESK